MIARCSDPEREDYENYGGRGITVCNSWRDGFENFLSDMGLRPSGLQLDRIDVNAGYGPTNCRWVTRKENGRNRRCTTFVIHDGERIALADIADRFNVKLTSLRYRISLGWDLDRALTQDNRHNEAVASNPEGE